MRSAVSGAEAHAVVGNQKLELPKVGDCLGMQRSHQGDEAGCVKTNAPWREQGKSFIAWYVQYDVCRFFLPC